MRTPLLVALAAAGLCTSASAIQRTYQYYRFSQTALRNPATTLIQVAEFRFYNGATALPMGGVIVTNPGGSNPGSGAENPDKLVDGNVNTKWLDFNKQPVIFDFGAPVTVDRYDFTTANDGADRDPVSWTLEGSADGTTWALLDEVVNNSTPQQRFAAAAPYVTEADVFTLDPVVIKEFYADKAIYLNGSTADLTWFTELGDTFSMNQGIGPVNANDVAGPTPANNGDTTYTLTGTNTIDGSHARSVTVRAVAGGVSNFQYVRFTPTKLRQSTLSNSIQLAELRFLSGVTPLAPVSVTNPGGLNPGGGNEGPDKLNDDNYDTKWLDFNKMGLIYDFGSAVDFDGYFLVTANDAADRDPVRWTIEGSNDQTTWTLIDNVTAFDFPMPKARKAFTQDIPLPGASITPFAFLTGDAPKLIDGEPLLLTWSSIAAASVSIDNGVGTVATSGSIAVNPTADTTYTLSATSAGGTVSTATFTVDVIDPAITVIDYDNFDAAGEEIALLGTSSVVNDFALIPAPGDFKRLRINPDTGSQVGTAWFRKRIDASVGFSTTFDTQFITLNATSTGADGMAFIIQNDPSGTAKVPSGDQENGLPANALNIKLDSYQNDGDLSAAVIQVRAGATVLQSVDLNSFPKRVNLGGTDSTDMSMNSGTDRPYRIRIDYVPGDLDVYFDNVLVIDSVDVDLGAINAVDASGTGYVGFSARSGGQFEAHDITSWALTEGLPPAAPVPPGALVITSAVPNFATDEVQLTWGSNDLRSYKVTFSTDLIDWSTELGTGIPGAAGMSETSATLDFTESTKGFFRVEEE